MGCSSEPGACSSERLKLQALNVGIWIWRVAKIGIEAKLLERKNIVVGKLFGLQICKDHWISQTSVDIGTSPWLVCRSAPESC